MEEAYKSVTLKTIQKENLLNRVSVDDDPHPKNKGHHLYSIGMQTYGITLRFQNGPRNEVDSSEGILDVDLLEIVRHRLKSFEKGPYACAENLKAIGYIERALIELDFRQMKRKRQGKLGTHKI